MREQASRIIGLVLVVFELSGSFIEPVQRTRPAEPEITLCVSVDAVEITALAERVCDFLNQEGSGVPRLLIESIQGSRKKTYPEDTFAVLIIAVTTPGDRPSAVPGRCR